SGRLLQQDPDLRGCRAGDVFRPARDVLLGPGCPADHGLGLLPHELEDELVDVQPVGEGAAGLRQVGGELHVLVPRAFGLLADGAQRCEQLLLCALLGEEHLDRAFELDDRRLTRLVEPSSQGLAAPVCDRVDGPGSPAGVFAGGGGESVGDELLRLLVDLALRSRPVVAGAALHLLRELVGRPAAQRQMAEDDVRGGGELWELTHNPHGSIYPPMGSIGGVLDRPDRSPLSRVRVRDARTDELDELARLLAEVYGAFRTHLPARAWERYIGEIVDVRSRLGE